MMRVLPVYIANKKVMKTIDDLIMFACEIREAHRFVFIAEQ